MSIIENDLCEIDDIVVICSDEVFNGGSRGIFLDSDIEFEYEIENMENKLVFI